MHGQASTVRLQAEMNEESGYSLPRISKGFDSASPYLLTEKLLKYVLGE